MKAGFHEWAWLGRLREILLRQDFEFSELQGGLLEVIWGLWLLLPYYHDPPFEIFRVLLATMRASVWSILFLGVGSCQLAALLARHYLMRRASVFVATMLWIFTALLLGLADWHILSFPLASAFAIGSAWGFLRIGISHESIGGIQIAVNVHTDDPDAIPASALSPLLDALETLITPLPGSIHALGGLAVDVRMSCQRGSGRKAKPPDAV